MRIPRIYIDKPLSSGATIELSIEAHRHVVNVLRLKENSLIILFNGDGNDYRAKIISIEKKLTLVNIENEQVNQTTSPLNIELGISLIKNDKLDFALQKSVELGISSITPLIANRSTIKLDEKRELKRHKHWQGIIQSACEQSGRSILPTLNPVHSISDWLDSSSVPGIVFEPTAEQTLSSLKITNEVRIIIGPEGGFNETELELIGQHDFYKTKLGPRILRAETAAIAAITTLQLLYGDLNR